MKYIYSIILICSLAANAYNYQESLFNKKGRSFFADDSLEVITATKAVGLMADNKQVHRCYEIELKLTKNGLLSAVRK